MNEWKCALRGCGAGALRLLETGWVGRCWEMWFEDGCLAAAGEFFFLDAAGWLREGRAVYGDLIVS